MEFISEKETEIKNWGSSSQIDQISSIFFPLVRFFLLICLVTLETFLHTFPRTITTAVKAVTLTRSTLSKVDIQCKVGVSTHCNYYLPWS